MDAVVFVDGFRAPARAAAWMRVCSKDVALFGRSTTERVSLISCALSHIIIFKLIEISGFRIRTAM
jgi:hypothetical protein